jgi:hypothetical protein
MTALIEVADQIAGPAFDLPTCRDEWVYRNVGGKNADLAFFRITGSAEFDFKELRRGDTVVINRARTKGDGVYALSFADPDGSAWTAVRRLQQWKDGRIRDLTARDTYARNEVTILGMIVWPRIC